MEMFVEGDLSSISDKELIELMTQEKQRHETALAVYQTEIQRRALKVYRSTQEGENPLENPQPV